LTLPPATTGIAVPALATAVGIAGALAGLWLTDIRRRAAVVLPFSAGVLLGVALFGLVPELVIEIGWAASLLLFGAGYGLLMVVDRVHPVCPSCSHDHEHAGCSTELHGFAAPLIIAAALHSFLDGWSIAAVQSETAMGLRIAVPLAVALHKIPEGIALGGIMRASMSSRSRAAAWCVLAEASTLLGAALGLMMAPRLGTAWITYPLGVAAGWLCYLGFHAVHEEWKRRGPAAASLSAFAGMAGAAAIQRGAEALFK
jgi:zinc transporter ZupT